MERRRQVYEQPQYVDPGMVNIPNIQMFSPEIGNMAMQGLNKSQERYDAAQGTIAKYLEDMGSVPVRDADKANVYGKLQSDLDNIHAQVKGGGGDYGAYLPEIIKSLSKARGTMHLASQDYAKEQEARKIYQAQLAQGKAPRTMVRGEDGKVVERPMTFDEFTHGLGDDRSGFTKEGQYKGFSVDAIRGRGEHDKWSMENVSKPIMQQIEERNPEIMRQLGPAFEGMYRSVTTGGMSDAEVEHYFTKVGSGKKDELMGDVLTNTFLNNSTFAKEEFTNPNGTVDFAAAKDYLKDLVKAQTVRRSQQQLGNLPQQKEGANTSGTQFPKINTSSSIEDAGKIERVRKNLNSLLEYVSKDPNQRASENDVLKRRYSGASSNPSISTDELAISPNKDKVLEEFKKNFAPMWNKISSESGPITQQAKEKIFVEHLLNTGVAEASLKRNELSVTPNEKELFDNMKQSLTRALADTKLIDTRGNEKIGSEIFGEGGKEIAQLKFEPSKGNLKFTIGGNNYTIKNVENSETYNELKAILKVAGEIYKGAYDYSKDNITLTTPVTFTRRFRDGVEREVKPTFDWELNTKTGEKTLYESYEVFNNETKKYEKLMGIKVPANEIEIIKELFMKLTSTI
jgi:hypothetical protein